MNVRDHLLALTVRGQSLLQLIGSASGGRRGAGSDAVLELEEIIKELRRVYPPPLFKAAKPLLYPIVHPRLSDGKRTSIDMQNTFPGATSFAAPVVAALRSAPRRRTVA